jgi:uncharacterized protein (DUF58 family)
MTSLISLALQDGQQAGARYSLAAPRRAPQGAAGVQLSRAAGESLEFIDHREYQPGDDLRRLDWAAYARTDKMIVKLYRQEVCPHLDLLIDGSRSMDLEGTAKARAAAGLAAALATAADNAGYSRQVYLTSGGCRPIEGSRRPPTEWRGVEFASAESPPRAMRVLPPAWRPRGIRVLISDLLWLGEPLELLTPLADGAAAAHVIQVLAADDADPQSRGNVRLVDSEGGGVEELFLDDAALARYRANLQRHADNWRRAARQVGGTMTTLTAETLAADWNLSALVEAEILTL